MMEFLLLAFSSLLPVALAWFIFPHLVHTVVTKTPSFLASSIAFVGTFGVGIVVALVQKDAEISPLLGLAVAIGCVWLSGRVLGAPLANPAKLYNRKAFVAFVLPVAVFLVAGAANVALDALKSG